MNIKKVMSIVLSTTLIAGIVPVNIAYASENKSIITGVECGMTESEVIEIVGNDIVYTLDSSNINPEDQDYTNFYNADKIELFNIELNSVILTEFSGDNILNGYGYNIGTYYNEETQKFEYPYSESELVQVYDSIYSQLVQWYGEAEQNEVSIYGTIKDCSWSTEYGEILLVVGMDLFGISSGVNKVMLTCAASESDEEYMLGDVNSDNVINASDASEILAEYANLSAGESSVLKIELADINGDSTINASDASGVLSYYAYTSSGGTDTLENFLKYESDNPDEPSITTTTALQTEPVITSESITDLTTETTTTTTEITTTTTTTTTTETTTTAVTLDNVQQFVSDLYTGMLKRDYDESGLGYWSDFIYNKERPLHEVVINIMDSNEFKTKNVSDNDYINSLYNGLLGRECDEEGLNHWLASINNGRSRFSIFLGFIKSEEFQQRIKSMGLSEYNFNTDIVFPTVKAINTYYIYTNADFDSDVIGTVYDGQILNVTGVKGEWLRVQFHNRTGFIYSDRVSNYELPGIKVLPVMNIPQTSYIGGEPLPTGCEVTSLSVLMNYLGFTDATKNNLAYNYMPRGEIGYTDPNYAFIGTPSSSSSYGAYANVMVKTANNYFDAIGETGYTVQNISGSSLSDILEHVKKGNPVLVWHTMNCTYTRTYGATWYFDRGMEYTEPGTGTYSFTWKRNEHCSVLVGYNENDNTIILADVWANSGASTGGLTEYNAEQFESGFNWLGNQAVVITK